MCSLSVGPSGEWRVVAMASSVFGCLAGKLRWALDRRLDLMCLSHDQFLQALGDDWPEYYSVM